jgi:hypothetical protein
MRSCAAAMVAIYFMYYNFARIHQTLRVTPAMEAGVTLSVLAIVVFWGWVLRRGLKTTNRRNKRVFIGCALLVFLVMLWNVYISLTSSN